MKHIKWIAIGILGLCGLIFLINPPSCKDADLEYWKGMYESEKQKNEDLRNQTAQEIENLRNIIAQKDAFISKINEEVEEKYAEIEKLHGVTDELESVYKTLTNNIEKIHNLESQVSTWKEKFTLAESIIKSKNEIIFDMNEKYVAQLNISNKYKELYENEQSLRELAEKRLNLADKKLSGLRFQLNLGKGVVIGLGALIIYGLVK